VSKVTGIEWTDHTWNPWIGCTPVSAACDHCYAAAMAARWGWARFEAGAPRRRTSAANWQLPARWNRQAAAAGQPATVFPSLCDPFDAEVDPAWLGEMLALFEPLGWLRLLLLTKRPHLAAKYFAGRTVPDTIALGTTAEDQKMLELRGPQILGIGARWHFLSYEPALGAIDLRRVTYGAAKFSWVIAGGESGPKARPSHPDWYRSLRDQCLAAEVPFFFKQWGAWIPEEMKPDHEATWKADLKAGRTWRFPATPMRKVGKQAAGAALDGREWRELPDWSLP
jgi:protein gp37